MLPHFLQRRERKSSRRTPARGDPVRVIRKFFRLLGRLQREGRAARPEIADREMRA